MSTVVKVLWISTVLLSFIPKKKEKRTLNLRVKSAVYNGEVHRIYLGPF